MTDLIAADYLRHTDREPWSDDTVLLAGQGDVLRAPSDADRQAWDPADDGYDYADGPS